MNLANKRIIVTGASGGLGQALCAGLLARDARVIGLDIDSEALVRLADAYPSSQLTTFHCDISNYDQCLSVVTGVRNSVGEIHALINNAGITHFSRFTDSKIETLQRVIDVNLKGAINITHACLATQLSQHGKIVGICSVAGFGPLYGRSAYCASKHGLAGLMKTLSAELSAESRTTLTVYPGFIQTQKRARDPESTTTLDTAKPGQAAATLGTAIAPIKAATAIITAMQKDSKSLYLGRVARLSRLVNWLSPSLYERLMLKNTRQEFGDHR